MKDEELTIDELADRLSRLNARFEKLADDFTNLREEVNEVERKLDRRT